MLVLITGGSKNGKSEIAERIVTSYDSERFYIATMEPYCDEALEAIERHRKIRSKKGFETIEKYTDINEIEIPENSCVLLECICNLCANEMFSKNINDPVDKIMTGVEKIAKGAKVFVVVTNQVGDDGTVYSPETMKYIKNIGEVNRRISEKADCVIEAVYGIPIVLKGEKPECLF